MSAEYGNLSQIFGQEFDVNSVESQSDFEALPPGKYPVLIEKAEVKQTKAGDGHYLKLHLRVIEGPYRSRMLWDQINIQNPSKECVEIGLRKLSALGKALGVTIIKDTDQLQNAPCCAYVKVKNERNEVRTYSLLSEPPKGSSSTESSRGAPYLNTPMPSGPESEKNEQRKPPWVR